MLSQKGPACSAAEQSAYLLSWFGEYSDLQRDDFLHVLAEKYTPLGPAGDGALGLSHLAIVNPDAPPSLFQCRMSLFDQWFQGWSDEDKASFLDRLRSLDPEFVDKLSSVPNGTADHSPTAPPMPPATTTVLVNHCTSVTVNGDSLKVDDDEEVEEEEEEEGNREVVSPTEEPQPMPRNVVSPSAGSVEEERVSPMGEKIEYEEQDELVL
ncbi:uncharacterized protein LOC119373808 [Rhipicephalus sanguineus]|uniref:uncharacterized protein LOC119373808 n=1 Tax=Rhipicephalus sanguineus TaxID=34632 RepID=UPI001893A13B|nr:uncharacterized protein LOC119373808 [Rhipicephalus sanguineus]XP_037499793.1 uncharacterized protein LOC119373808 [Rhipicephalus sanguineus]XP_037499794.1 uncharacterized protein LOC119373808 [Rhipicephalus sanguineus]XP_037499799.1 uncharacterized protein LOC119373808 [Rhipicephalus sanguineus]XP_049266776.1 uncharacterized protein LOC119373808 [Rhipicephalus sanguineus]